MEERKMRAVTIAAAVAVFAIFTTGECQAHPAGNVTEILPGSPAPRNVKIFTEGEQNVGERLPCSTVDVDNHLLSARNGLIDTRYRWKYFYIYIDPVYNDAHRDTIIEAMRQLADVLHCVKFGVFNKGAQPSGDYIHIVNKEECWSFIGKRGGRQEMSLQIPQCVYVGIILHEMIHSLGFTHEQTRADRDNHVNVFTDNVRPERRKNFGKVTNGYSTLGVAYNYRSIMHYGPFEFSTNNKPVITKKDGSTDGIGTVGKLQSTDIQRLKKMYQCD